ncbi:MAG: methyltransferase domain-containing protein [Nitrospirae bacterium]|nr:methyltransferase domain-containing protein [Candidatus Troglogloeales bacterium]
MDAKSIDQVYSFYSGFYDVIWNKVFHESREEGVSLLGLRGGERILDVGVGTGLSLLFYPHNCKVVGIDLCDAMLQKGRDRLARHRYAHIELYEMDAMKMDFPDNSFDAIFAAYTISAVPDHSKVINEMIRVCKKGGKLVFLNHFKNGNRLISTCEKIISPLTKKMGFRADLELSTLFSGKPIMIEKRQSMKPFNYWDLVLCVNQKSENGNGQQRCR